MAIVIDIIDDGGNVSSNILPIDGSVSLAVDVVPSVVTDVVVPQDPVVVEVLAGLPGAPGVQNVFVGPTPPDNPQEDWIWVDTNA